MATNYPLALDTYADKVDGVDDVMAAHVNDLQDAIEALEETSQSQSLLKVTNSSGVTVTANQVGYIDEAGEFKTTTTAFLIAAWCVVIVGGIDTADIIVATRGRCTVELNGNCSKGDFLYISTTKQGHPLSYLRPEVFAVAQSANAGGTGGTCDALLLTQRATQQLNGTARILDIRTAGDSDWLGTQNGAPVGQIITYTAPLTAGQENSIVPFATTELGKLVLHNTTKGEEAYIETVNIGANDIQITDAADTVGWENGDVLSVRSQTNTRLIGASRFFDVYLQSTEIPALAVAILANWRSLDNAPSMSYHHQFEVYSDYNLRGHSTQVAGCCVQMSTPISIINRRFTVCWDANAAATRTEQYMMFEVILAIP